MKNRIYICTIKMNKKFIFLLFLFMLILLLVWIYKINFLQTVFHSYEKRIVIDPGHGGIDSGTGEKFGIYEKQINLDVALRLRKLVEKDFKVTMTRDKDISLENKSDLNDSRYKKDLHARKTIINQYGDLFVSIHVNADPYNSKTRGVKIFYYPTSEESKKLAHSIKKEVDKIVYKEDLKKAEVIKEDYYVLRETTCPGVLVEIGFITNVHERKLMQNSEYKNKIVKSISEGIKNYAKKSR
ncbi:N-acetylmuramoyl-L-alanine amidase family protein [Anaerophilus nitritogenes]|uniref:N-acetylmuramoyl-L-alanine amidase family protein n=1 Tax=Anaerophilus nitritogenes TaxID=2498136 RepID=UPI00101D7CFB|nr:N-acetylmuramoyl-L-alanine amidase [Anaerophilus nitritogenes]